MGKERVMLSLKGSHHLSIKKKIGITKSKNGVLKFGKQVHWMTFVLHVGEEFVSSLRGGIVFDRLNYVYGW